MRMVYIFNHPVIETKHIGIRKKINRQIQAFKRCGYDPIFIVLDEYRVYIEDFSKKKKTITYFYSPKECYEYAFNYISNINPQILYARHNIINSFFIMEFYQRLSKLDGKLIYEFYTYPYDNEYPENDIKIIIDKYYRENLKDFIQVSTNYTGDTEILGIPSIMIRNGIDLATVTARNNFIKNDEKSINLVGISLLYFWHGYDRVIEGLHNYYSQNQDIEFKIYFHIIGEGEEGDALQKLVKLYNLEEQVIFHGKIFDENRLNRLLKSMDIGIGSLGIHRLGLQKASPLKTAEYCARSLPFVIDYEDVSFDSKIPFVLKISGNDKALDVYKIIKFYKKNRSDKTFQDMRQYAESNLTWDSIIKNLLDNIL